MKIYVPFYMCSMRGDGREKRIDGRAVQIFFQIYLNLIINSVFYFKNEKTLMVGFRFVYLPHF